MICKFVIFLVLEMDKLNFDPNLISRIEDKFFYLIYQLKINLNLMKDVS